MKENPSLVIRWGHWFNLAREYWRRFQSSQLIPRPWVSAYLSSSYKGQKVWEKKLIFDLGCHLTPVEADLLLRMQDSQEIEVIRPHPPWGAGFKNQWGYDLLESDLGRASQPAPQGVEEENFVPGPLVRFLRFSTRVSEVKEVTARVRAWLDSGVPVEEIAVLAPDMEAYGAVLHSYFEQEGLPVDRPVAAALFSSVEVSRWLSALRVHMGQTHYEDFEWVEYGGVAEPRESFESFHRLLQVIYDRRDLKKLPRMYKKFLSDLDTRGVLTRDEFIEVGVHLWGRQRVDLLSELLDHLVQDVPLGLRLPLRQWLMYVEELCACVEWKVSEPSEGIQLTHISSGPRSGVKYMCLMGLTDPALNGGGGTSIEPSDAHKIHEDTGFVLDVSDSRRAEFEARWLMEGDFKEVCVSFSSSDFQGSVEGPSRLWLQGALGQATSGDKSGQEVQTPSPTRWDEIQLAPIEALGALRGWSEKRLEDLKLGLAQEGSPLFSGTQGLQSLSPIHPRERPSLSVTQLENYLKCPFIFAAHKLFRFKDVDAVDIDVDNLTKGRWMHSLFRELTRSPFREDYTESELMDIVDSCRGAGDVVKPAMWEMVRGSLLELIQRFLCAEGELRRNFPNLCTEGREVSVEADWSLQQGTLVPRGQGDYLFVGSVDRVDTNGKGEASVVDYKSSYNSVRNFKSWEEGGSLQLSLYAQAIERGLTELAAPGELEVCSAFYYVSKDMKREKGFRMKDRGGDLYEPRGHSCAESPAIREVQEALMSKVQEVVQKVNQGLFEPTPRDKKICQDCRWRTLCRAPHLNL